MEFPLKYPDLSRMFWMSIFAFGQADLTVLCIMLLFVMFLGLMNVSAMQ